MTQNLPPEFQPQQSSFVMRVASYLALSILIGSLFSLSFAIGENMEFWKVFMPIGLLAGCAMALMIQWTYLFPAKMETATVPFQLKSDFEEELWEAMSNIKYHAITKKTDHTIYWPMKYADENPPLILVEWSTNEARITAKKRLLQKLMKRIDRESPSR
jgi:hypothetical protein